MNLSPALTTGSDPPGSGPAAPNPGQAGLRSRLLVRHLMTMTSGLACDDYDDASPGSEARMQSQTAEPDWHRYALGLPFVHAPGEHYAYCSAGTNLLGGVLGQVAGEWIPDFFRRHIAKPLRFGRYHINLMPTGEAYLGGGTWRGRRIVSQRWVDCSTAPHVRTGEDAHGEPTFDGYGWHINRMRAGGRVFHEYEASGNGGQFVMVFPELDLVVGWTAGDYGEYGVWRRIRDDLVPQFVLPAAI